ncbi:MAG: thiamine-phosphate kinase [Halieaceae bacterium]
MTDEFSLIEKYFAPLSSAIGDDCAILELNPGERLATSVDTLVEGTHFYSDAPPDQVAYRAVVTALSDLAATGAEARAVTLALTLPEADDTWLRQFSRGLEQALETYKVELIGGDTTRGPLTITIQVMGAVPEATALARSGARVGDQLFVSGSTGDAAAALTVMDGQWPGHGQHKEYLLKRFYRPTARIELGQQLLTIATSAIDVSDGLLADAGHICEQSSVGIRIDAQRIPLSPALQSVPDSQQAMSWALTGGDDYELLFTVAADKADQVPDSCTRIGEVIAGDSVSCDVDVTAPGYQHFSSNNSPPTPLGSDPNGVGGKNGGNPAMDAPENKPQPFKSLPQFLAFGFGSGLAPKAPGTFGTLAAVPLYVLMSQLSLPLYTALVLVACVAGIWICGRASEELKVHDHPGIVWDEFAGFWITMWALPNSWYMVVAGFALFRLFDIAKPWPIRFYDKNLGGGWGIMLDDILAGIASCAILHGALYAWPLIVG